LATYSELNLEQGATVTVDVTLVDGSSQRVNLTNYTANSQIRKSYESITAYNFVVEITDSANGELTLTMSAANTANIRAGRYVYDLIIQDANIKTRAIEGIVTVMPSVTR
jgi:hypothetical protein